MTLLMAKIGMGMLWFCVGAIIGECVTKRARQKAFIAYAKELGPDAIDRIDQKEMYRQFWKNEYP